MIALFSSELLRIRSRRVLWVAITSVVVGTVLVVGFLTIRSQPPVALSEQEQARYEESLAQCLEGRRGYSLPDGLPAQWSSQEAYCADVVRSENFSRRHDGDRLQLSGLLDAMVGSAFIGLILALVLGASFAGADWHTGTMSSILTFEPRRLRVLFVRAVLTGLTVLTCTVFVEAVLVACVWAGASLRGSTQGLAPDFWTDVLETGARVTAAAVLTSWIGLGIAMIGRNTAAAMGALLGYVAVFEVLFRGLSPGVATKLFVTNIGVMVSGATLEVPEGRRVIEITPGDSVWVVVIYAAAVLVLAALAFRTRDVA